VDAADVAMLLTDRELRELLTKLIRLATYVFNHGGRFGHGQAEIEYHALRKALPAKRDGELAAELRALGVAIDEVVSTDGSDFVLADLHEARNRAVRVLTRDDYMALRGPMRCGFID
jgi:hypothetical protein